MESPRSQKYLVLRFCERLGITESLFDKAPYESQIRWLAYELLRQQEALGQ